MAKHFSGKIKARKTNTAESRALKTDEESAMSVSTPRGDHTINPNLTNVRLERLGRCYRGGKSAIRIWNTLTSTNPGESLDPGRIGPRQDQLGGMSLYGPCAVAPWIGITDDDIPNCKAEVFSAIISRQTPSTRSLRWKRDTYNVQKENVAFWNLPYPTFYHNCINAYESGEFGAGGAWDPKWNRLMKGGMSSSGTFREASIATMKNRYFAVCHIYELGETMNTTRLTYTNRDKQVEVVDRDGPFGLSADDSLYVLWMSSDCGSKILELCQRQKEDWSGDPDENPAGLYRYGDPCGIFNAETGAISGGNIFTIFNPKVWQPDNTKNSTWNGVVPGERDVASYQVKVNASYTADSGVKYSASMTADEAGQIFEKNLFGWKEEGDEDDSYLLHEVSVEEEATLTARAFADVPKLLEFAWMSNPEYLQYDSVQAVVNARSQFVMPKEAYEKGSPEEGASEKGSPEEGASLWDEANLLGDDGSPVVTVASVEQDAVDATLKTDPDDEFEGGEIEAEDPTADDDEDFNDLASTFSSDFEEDKSSSDEFDPDEESSNIETAMEESMSKANSALAKTKSTKRTSPKRKLKRRS